MAYKPALGEGELHSLNYKAIRSWLAANKGTVVVVLPKLTKGSHKLKAVYLGSTLVNKGTGPVVTLKST